MNCPFDTEYKSIFNAIIFAIFDCGYVARCALEIDDAGQVRIDKIGRIIADSKFGVHDISRTELDQHTELPRFNVPLELGMFLGAKRFGNTHQKAKVSLIIDRELYRYQRFMSDISGQDIRSHQNDPLEAIRIIRNWLSDASKRRTIPGGREISRRYGQFQSELPEMCQVIRTEQDELTFNDYTNLVSEWLQEAE